MGISSKKTKSKTTPIYGQQITGAAGALNSVYNQQAPKVGAIADSLTGMIPGMIDKVNAGNPAVNAASGYVTDTLSGDGTNPHLEGWIADQQNQTQNMLGARLNKLGLGPAGTTHQGLSARENARVGLGMRYDDWNQGQQRKAQAAGMAPSIAAGEAVGVAPLLSVAQLGTSLPMDLALRNAAGTGGLLGQYTNTEQKQSGGLAGGLLGSLLSGWATGGFKI
jgi:hypothetical protein